MLPETGRDAVGDPDGPCSSTHTHQGSGGADPGAALSLPVFSQTRASPPPGGTWDGPALCHAVPAAQRSWREQGDRLRDAGQPPFHLCLEPLTPVGTVFMLNGEGNEAITPAEQDVAIGRYKY